MGQISNEIHEQIKDQKIGKQVPFSQKQNAKTQKNYINISRCKHSKVVLPLKNCEKRSIKPIDQISNKLQEQTKILS